MNLRSRRWALLAALSIALGAPTPAGAQSAVGSHASTLDGDLIEVSSIVRGGDGPPALLPGVTVTAWQWLGGDDNLWIPAVGLDGPSVTGATGQFTLLLEAGQTYTLRFETPDETYPTQFLGGGPAEPSAQTAADWDVATFIAGQDALPSSISLYRALRFSGSGMVTGDEDGELGFGYVDLVEIADGGVPGEDSVANLPLGPDGTFTFHGLRAGSRYTIRVLADSYLPTYLGNTTQPELATTFVVADAQPILEEIELRRGAPLTGTITSQAAPVELAHVTALRWDPAGERWLSPTHYGGTTTDTEPDGSWGLLLEPGVRYTLFVDTADATGASGQLPASHYLGGETTPPAPNDPAATFELLPSGDHKEWGLTAPRIALLTAPLVAGTAQVGAQLTSTTGAWAVSDASFSRQWLRGSTPIPGATSDVYTPTADDVGQQLAVRVTASKTGFATAEAMSAATEPVAPASVPTPDPPVVDPPPAPKASTTTALTLSKSSAKFGSKVTATVTVDAPAGTPDGVVTLRLGSKVLATKRPAVRGTTATATFTLPRTLKAGTHRLVASVASTATTAGSTSTVRVLRTTKAKPKVTVKGPKKWRIAKGKRPRLTITVKGTKGAAKPTGKVVVKIGKKKYVKRLKAGKVTVRGVKLRKAGRVKVAVTYRPAAKTYTKPKVVRKTLRVR